MLLQECYRDCEVALLHIQVHEWLMMIAWTFATFYGWPLCLTAPVMAQGKGDGLVLVWNLWFFLVSDSSKGKRPKYDYIYLKFWQANIGYFGNHTCWICHLKSA